MKIYAVTPRQYALGTLICVAACVLIGVLLDVALPTGWAFTAAAVMLPLILLRMVMQPIGRRSGQIVTLALVGGGVVKLPIWGQSGQIEGPMDELLRTPRATVRPASA